MTEWFGWERLDFEFEGRKAILVFPKKEVRTDRWMLKTEYFGAFPNAELMLLSRGFHLAYVENINRWGLDEDIDAKARFADYVTKTYGLREKCVPVGMSCGGMFGIDFASAYPDKVECLYLDAPVLNLLSCAGGLGRAEITDAMRQEMLDALSMTMADLIAYRKHPMDRLRPLVEHRIPAVMVYGDSDRTVPYEENGIHLERAYREADVPLLVIGKPGCDHHPHGLEDPTPIADFIETYSRA